MGETTAFLIDSNKSENDKLSEYNVSIIIRLN